MANTFLGQLGNVLGTGAETAIMANMRYNNPAQYQQLMAAKQAQELAQQQAALAEKQFGREGEQFDKRFGLMERQQLLEEQAMRKQMHMQAQAQQQAQAQRQALGNLFKAMQAPAYAPASDGMPAVPLPRQDPLAAMQQYAAAGGDIGTLGKLQQLMAPAERKIVEQGGVQYYADTGKPVIKSPVNGGIDPSKFKEGQIKTAGYANRMEGTEDIFSEFESDPDFNPLSLRAEVLGGALGRMLRSPEQQRYKNAADEWIRAKLRRESGAAIPPEEMAQEYMTYFPQVGDGKEVVEQKKKLRQRVGETMKKESVGAYEVLFGGNAPRKVTTPKKSFSSIAEAEAANLPRGTEITINGRRAVVE